MSTALTKIESLIQFMDDKSNISNLSSIQPQKSKFDKRNYRIFTLQNGLETIIVSDPTTEKGACSMDVHVGHYSDPSSIPGLAHFLEHMLFLGTKKYPNEAEYDQFIKDHGGSNNACTSSHHTNYDFDVDSKYLKDTLDRFAQFFISPLFTESATNRELNAVNSEHCNNLQEDYCRIFQFDKLQSRVDHPWHKFDTGNLETLKVEIEKNKIDLRGNLLKFHKSYYGPKTMKLAVVGKEDLDTLTKMVYDTFNGMEAMNDITTPRFSHDAFDKSSFPKLYKIIPIKEKRDLTISWIMDPIYDKIKTKPTSLLSYCIGHEGKGSILSYLKIKGYATGLLAGISYNKPEFAIFECTVNLTINGLTNWKDVVFIIYQYIERLKMLTDKQWRLYFDERQKVDEMRFMFKGKEHPYDYVESLSRALQNEDYEREMLLKYVANIAMEFDVTEIKKYLSMLNVKNAYYYLLAKDYENEAKEEEKWYGTKYKTDRFDQGLLEKWSEIKLENVVNELQAPLENKYIADNFEIYDDGKDNDDEKMEIEGPVIIHETKGSKVYFKKDEVFKRPKLCFSIKLQSPNLDESVLTQNLTNLLFLIFEDELSEEIYAFQEADLNYKCKYYGQNIILFEFKGYNDKLHILAGSIIDKFINFKFSKEKFEINKERLRQNLESKLKQEPYQQVGMFGGYLYYKKTKSIFKLIENVNSDKLTYDASIQQYQKILNGKLFAQALIFGNSTKDLVKKNFITLIEDKLLKKSSLYSSMNEVKNENKLYQCMKFERNKDYILRFKSTNKDDDNSCIGIDYFYEMDSNKDCLIFGKLKLFSWIIDAPFFDELRTKQQLGYIVWSWSSFNKGMLSLRTVIQSPTKDPLYLDKQIEIFLNDFKQFLINMTQEIFELNKQSVINDLLEKPKTINEQHSTYWNEIWIKRYQFNRVEAVADAVKMLKKEDILAFYDEYISNTSKKRCRVVTQCFVVKENEKELTFDDGNDNIVIGLNDIPKTKLNSEYTACSY